MSKRGISALIATVLIIGFTIAIAAIVLVWGTGFVKDIQESTEKTTEKQMTCSGDVRLDIKNARFLGDKIELLIENIGNKNIEKFNVRIYGDDGGDNAVIESELVSFDIENFEVGFDLAKTGIVNEIEVFPSITFEDELVVCSNSYDKEENIEIYPYILTGENEKFSNGNKCSPDLYVLENDKIKFFVSVPIIRDSTCSSGSDNGYAGIPMRIWAKNTQSSGYRKNGMIIDNTRMYTPTGTSVGSMDQFNPLPNTLEVNFNKQGDLEPKIKYILRKGWNYVRVEFSVENTGSSEKSVQLRWEGDNDPPSGTWRNDEGDPTIPSKKWISFYPSSLNDIYGVLTSGNSQEIKLLTWAGIRIREDSAINLNPGQTHTIVFYIMSDFKGPGGNEWKPVEDLYNSL